MSREDGTESIIDPSTRTNQGRLQRRPDASGTFITSFRQVAKRHGITMALAAITCLLLPGALIQLGDVITPLLTTPLKYSAWAGVLFLFFVFFQSRRGYGLHKRHICWLGYLLFISIVEEIAFRLLLPFWLADSMSFIVAALLSNALFACIHYFTLRWHWWNCLFAFVGGMGFSQMLATTQDLTVVIFAHWLFTFLNTPVPPSGGSSRRPIPV